MNRPPATLPQEFRHLASERADATMLRQKRLGVWQPCSWREMARAVDCVAAALSELGLRAGQVVVIVSQAGRDWVAADLAAQTAGAVVAGLHLTETPQAMGAALRALDARLVFIEDEELFEDLLEAGGLQQVEHVCVFRSEGLRRARDARLVTLRDLETRGARVLDADAALPDRLLGSRHPADAAAIVYTSGATGAPQPVLLSHAALIASAAGLGDATRSSAGARDERLLFLAPSHALERVGGIYASLLQGAVMNFVEGQDTVFDNLREVQPELLLTVPRIWERLHSSLTVALGEATRFQQWAYAAALRSGRRVAEARERGARASAALRLGHWMADGLVLGKLRRAMGVDRVKLGIAAGAPISPELVRWYRAMGVDLRQAWGLAEMGGYVAVAGAGDPPEACGKPLAGAELRLADDGEILVRGAAAFAGYHGDPQGTGEAVEAGWIRSGDLGRLDASGRLTVTGRRDEVILTAAGERVLPAEVENRIKASPYVADVVAVGEGRPHLACLLMIDRETVEQWAQDRQLPFSDFRSLCECREVVELVGQEIERACRDSKHSIDAFRLIDTPAEADAESLTPVMKLRRWRVLERHGAAIDSMYAASAA